MVIYRKLVRPVLFKMDPEFVHNQFTTMGVVFGSNPLTRSALSAVYRYENPALVQDVDGITYRNPIGLAAGFDKDCKLMKSLPHMGFGYEEVGSITNEPYAGNPKPRMVRLPKDKAIIVFYGLKNKGAKVTKQKFMKDGKRVKYQFPIGISIAKTNKNYKSQQEKVDDWVAGIKALNGCSDYVTINLSCPNTYDPQNFCEPHLLSVLLEGIVKAKIKFNVPVYLKMSADLSIEDLDKMIDVVKEYPFIKGFIFSNLVKDRSTIKLKSKKSEYEPYKGGISGPHVKSKSLKLIAHTYKRTKGKYTIIACGGIFTPEDAYEYIKSGANLLQMITGMIYGGPATIKRINKGLVELAKSDGYTNISQARGAAFKQASKRRSAVKKKKRDKQ